MTMKNRFLSTALALLALCLLVACDPQEGSDYKLGPMPTADQLDFTVAPSASTPNRLDVANASKVPGVVTWDFGNESTAKGETAQAAYPFKGEYTITMTLYTTGGSASVSKSVSIANDDMTLLNTPMYNALTGGAANLEGKTWVFDSTNDGHIGVGPVDDSAPSWWSCEAGGKTECSLYTQEFTFTQVGIKFEWKNNGYIYTNEAGRAALAGKGYATSVVPGAGDFDVKYEPKASYTFTLNEAAKTLTLSGDAFMGHYAGTSTYEILNLTDDEMYLKCASTVEDGNGWWYRFVPKK